jgi:hypothetical protein
MASALPLLKSNSVIPERGLVVIERNSIRPNFGDVYRREIEELSRFTFALSELLFRLLALCDIHNGPDKLYELARLVQDGMAYSVEMLDVSIGKNNAVVLVKVCFLGYGSIKELPNALLVLEMSSAKPKFSGRRILIRLDAEYSKHLR